MAAAGGAAGGRLGLRVQLLKAVRILPGHPLNEDLPSWSFSMAGDFSKSTTCFFQKPRTEVAVRRDEKHGRDFPFCAFGIQRHLCFTSSPRAPLLFKAAFLCPFPSCSHILLFLLFVACHPLCSGKFPQSCWPDAFPLCSLISPQPPHTPFLTLQFQVSSKFSPTVSLVPFWCRLLPR